MAVSLSLANRHASLPVAYRLYLPENWAGDSERRRKVGVPEEISFATKPAIALEQVEAACKAGLPRGVVLMDAGYGCSTELRDGIRALKLSYVAGILPQTTVWVSGTGPLPPKKWSGRGRPPKLSAETTSINRSRSRSLLSACQSERGARLSGARVNRSAVLALCARACSGGASRLQSDR